MKNIKNTKEYESLNQKKNSKQNIYLFYLLILISHVVKIRASNLTRRERRFSVDEPSVLILDEIKHKIKIFSRQLQSSILPINEYNYRDFSQFHLISKKELVLF